MIKAAILALKERKGSSRQAVKKYIQANNKIAVTDAAFNSHINRALASGEKAGVFERPKGASGPVKLKAKTVAAKTEAKPAAPAAKKPAAATAKVRNLTTSNGKQ
jgi:histone H1/5